MLNAKAGMHRQATDQWPVTVIDGPRRTTNNPSLFPLAVGPRRESLKAGSPKRMTTIRTADFTGANALPAVLSPPVTINSSVTSGASRSGGRKRAFRRRAETDGRRKALNR